MLRREVVGLGIVVLALVLAACTAQAAGPGESPTDQSHGKEIGGYVELVDGLRGVGAPVEPAGEVEQPFFSVEGEVIKVNGADVQVFEYADEMDRKAESEQISPDGSTVGKTMISWLDQPNFWAKGRVIVLYVGKDKATLDLLNRALGDPITGRSDAPHPDPPQAVSAAKRRLSELLGIPVDEIGLVSFERVEWRDACLGQTAPDEMCAQVITPGWLIVLSAREELYEFHTDLWGNNMRWRESGEKAQPLCTEIRCVDGLTVELEKELPPTR